jgi:drug/metabolite transporter (DMT)-like permease
MKNLLEQYRNQILIHLIVLIWGFTGILGKLIELSSGRIVFFRMTIASLSLGLFMAFRKKARRSNWKQVLQYILVGFIIAMHWAFFFEALKVSTVSVTLTVLASTSLFVALIEPIFFRRKVDFLEVLFGLIVIVGLFMIFNFETEYRLGIIYSLIAAVAAAVFGTINGLFIRNDRADNITLWEMLGGVIGILAYLIYVNGSLFIIAYPSTLDWVYLLILGVICTAFAFVVSVEVMKTLSPFTVSISINMEPIYAIILALIFFGDSEYMSTGFYAGASLILLTVMANGILKSPRGKKMLARISKKSQ